MSEIFSFVVAPNFVNVKLPHYLDGNRRGSHLPAAAPKRVSTYRCLVPICNLFKMFCVQCINNGTRARRVSRVIDG